MENALETKGTSAVIVRKYKNRKLYNQKQHSYITLSDILTMYQNDISFSVIDAEGVDITENIIIQSIVNYSLENNQLRQIILDFAKNNTEADAKI